MWFAKWFGGRSDQADKPARIAPAPARPVAPAARVQSEVDGASLSFAPEVKRGFDPYNSSGSFNRNSGWDRVIIGR